MAKGFSRVQRVGQAIQTALAEILLRDVRDERFSMVTITHVDVAPDFANAKIYVSVWNDEMTDETVAALNHAAKYLRFTLAHAIDLRVNPQLRFVYDDSVARGSRISSLINSVLKDPKSK